MAKRAAQRRLGTKRQPRLKLIKNSKELPHTGLKTKRPHTLEVVKSEPTPYQQEALIIKYRLKARKLGRSILRRWHSRLEIDEVDSIVDLSLCEAVKRFDPLKGASFMTFLFYHLKGNLCKAVAAAAASTSIPNAIAELSESAFDNGERRSYSNGTLNAIELAEAISSEGIPQPDEALWRKELSSQSSNACEKLDDLEREIVKRIFVHEQQIIDIAAALGYSRCHISRVKKKALNTLHEELRVVMNKEDYRVSNSDTEEADDYVLNRVQSPRSVYRRKPRSASHKKRGIPVSNPAEAA